MPSYRAIPAYYDAENEQLDMLQHDVPFFLSHLSPNRRLSVLELAVGTGRAAIPIAQAGHRVVGVDYAPGMLEIARRKRDSIGLKPRELELLEGDVARLQLRRRFDWVCIFFNTFLGFVTLEKQDQVLQAVRRHLKPRCGRFWLDIFQPNLELLSRPHADHLAPTLFRVPELGRTVLRETELRPEPSRQLQHVTFHYTWLDEFSAAHRQSRQFDLTFIFPRELRVLLERNGLRLRKLWGNYDGSKLSADSPRMIAVASPER